MTVAIVSLAVLGVALPHLIRLDAARPSTAAVLWTASLTLRALIAFSAALFVLFVFPDTEAFKLLTHWCEHEILPVLGLHVDLHGHTLGAGAMLAPVGAVVAALVLSVLRTARGARSIHALLRTSGLGPGPQASVIVGGPEVVVASAGVIRPRIVVTAGALAALDDDELAAGLAHERGHIVRRHNLLLACAECCRAVARLLPGTRRAAGELRFHLERDADEWALRRHHDPCALASAICKAAVTDAAPHPAVATLGGALERRVDRLMDEGSASAGGFRRRIVDSAAVLMVFVTLTSVVTVPTEALAGGGADAAAHSDHHCVP